MANKRNLKKSIAYACADIAGECIFAQQNFEGIDLDELAQEQAAAVMAVAWHTILHHPIPEWSGLQSQVAFPFSPPSVPAGEVYHFALNHVLEVEDPKELFPITYSDL